MRRRDPLGRHPQTGRVGMMGLPGGSLALATTAAAYPLLLRPWHLRWGATDVEAREPLPGDELIPEPVSQSTRAIAIHAPVARVWPWVVQMGQGRGGLYSYTWLENLFGHDLHNAEQIVPEWQRLEGGDEFRLASAARYPTMALVVAAIEPPSPAAAPLAQRGWPGAGAQRGVRLHVGLCSATDRRDRHAVHRPRALPGPAVRGAAHGVRAIRHGARHAPRPQAARGAVRGCHGRCAARGAAGERSELTLGRRVVPVARW